MSEPKRYICTRVLGMFEMQEAGNGDWVSVEDYARLKAELRGKVMDSISDIGQLGEQSAEIAHLKAEVERLRKELADAQENYHLVNEMVARLRKEGKQP